MRIIFFKVNHICCLLLAVVISYPLNAQSDVLTEAEQMPFFIGCDDTNNTEEKRECSNKNLIRFISNHLVYPASAKEKQIEGTVFVSFVVNEFGKVTDSNIIRDIGEGCGKAALEVVNSMPDWVPAHHMGQAVKVKLNLPVRFDIKNDANNDKALAYEINWGNLTAQPVTKKQLEAQLNKPLYVRDQLGNEKPVNELIFSFEKRKSFYEGGSTGKINEDLKKVVGRCKKGGTFSITAVIQIKGDFIFVKRSFEII